MDNSPDQWFLWTTPHTLVAGYRFGNSTQSPAEKDCTWYWCARTSNYACRGKRFLRKHHEFSDMSCSFVETKGNVPWQDIVMSGQGRPMVIFWKRTWKLVERATKTAKVLSTTFDFFSWRKTVWCVDIFGCLTSESVVLHGDFADLHLCCENICHESFLPPLVRLGQAGSDQVGLSPVCQRKCVWR